MTPDAVVVTRSSLVLVLAFAACGQPTFDRLPVSIPHSVEEDGALHAERLEDPFLCGDPDRPMDLDRTAPCPTARPVDALLSCDASGCHGTYDFTPTSTRQLWGGEGPSCYTCHGEKWIDD